MQLLSVRIVKLELSIKKLTAAICLTLVLSLGTVSTAWSADFQKGFAAAQSGDYATALREWAPLATQGNALAQYNLGQMYRRGQGVPKNHKTAVTYYTLAAKQGDADAQNNLGWMYNNGKGVKQNYKTAVKWYALAAEQGEFSAQFNLGLMYDNGKGVIKDYKTAVKWYTLAAEQEHALAQYNLGYMYYNGHGVIEDDVYAHMWWNIAASSGIEDAIKNRGIVAKRMTPASISAAQDLARECVRKKYKNC